MADMWFKRCHQCGNYMKKTEPQESAICCACGWEEYVVAFYCETVNKYCTLLYTHQITGQTPRIGSPQKLARNK